jgi:formate-dependent nitrite reductase membrane component NrfD
MITGVGALAAGALCLFLDLGRADRVANLLLSPTFSHITLGTYALLLALLCAVAVSLLASGVVRLSPQITGRVRCILELGALIATLVVMLYTGLLFFSMGTGLLLGSFLVPVLFVLSSLSTGNALLLGVAYLSGLSGSAPESQSRGCLRAAVDRGASGARSSVCAKHHARLNNESRAALAHTGLFRLDRILILAELLCLAGFLLLAFGEPFHEATLFALTQGSYAVAFWGGLVICGLIAPLCMETSGLARRILPGIDPALPAAVCVLTGGYCLRYCILGAGLPLFAL